MSRGKVIEFTGEPPETFMGFALCLGCGNRWIQEALIDQTLREGGLPCPGCKNKKTHWTPWPFEYELAFQDEMMKQEHAVETNHSCQVYDFNYYKVTNRGYPQQRRD